MDIITFSHVNKSFGEQQVLEDVSFTVRDNDKIGIMGINGAGKTTLFRILMGEMDHDDGYVSVRKNLNLGYMAQQIELDSQASAYEEGISVFSDLLEMEDRIQELQYRMDGGDHSIETVEAFSKVQERYIDNGGMTYKSITLSVMRNLGLSETECHIPINSLSGGQKTRVMLAKLLLSKPDVLLLDEPTNHLDIEAIEWLEKYLSDYQGTILVISHDRYFLDRFVTKIYELENRRVTEYSGNYSDYIRVKTEREEALEKDYDKKMKELRRLEDMIDLQKRWNTERSFVTARHKEKAAERLRNTIIAPAAKQEEMRLRLTSLERSGNDVILVRDLARIFSDGLLFHNVSFDLFRQDRAFILGRNGTGKTTLIRMIMGEELPDEGEIRIGSKVDIGYYSQGQENLPDEKTILEAVYVNTDESSIGKIRTVLGSFMFHNDDVDKLIGTLSGGEKARVALAILMLSGCNLLILDEPTNHLDMRSREILENAILKYEGTVLAVSHDRYFIDKLATKVFDLSREGMETYPGTYSEYTSFKASREIPEETMKITEIKETSSGAEYRRKKAEESERRKRRTRLRNLETGIASAEEKIAKDNALLEREDIMSDYEKVKELSEEISALETELAALYAEWEVLAPIVEEENDGQD